MTAPTLQFFEGIAEDPSNVSLRSDKQTGAKVVAMSFETLHCIERFRAVTNRFAGSLKLTDEEGDILVEPSSVRFVFGGPEGDDFERFECQFHIDRPDEWDRFMRFMHRYAEANGMGYDPR
jgi:photosystem II Psb28-2 protein